MIVVTGALFDRVDLEKSIAVGIVASLCRCDVKPVPSRRVTTWLSKKAQRATGDYYAGSTRMYSQLVCPQCLAVLTRSEIW